jgi:hypothetical protein
MTKQRKSLDASQSALDFDQPIEAYTQLRDQLVKAAPAPSEAKEFRYEEYCIEIAVAIKKARSTTFTAGRKTTAASP